MLVYAETHGIKNMGARKWQEELLLRREKAAWAKQR